MPLSSTQYGSIEQPPVLVDVRDGYRVLTLNRPSRLNAFNVAMHETLMSALGEAEVDPDCRAVILTGTGRGFCTGQDLADRNMPPGVQPDLGASLEERYNPLVRALRNLRFPVICAVNGVAAGAGANLALACDIVIAAQSARFLELFSNLGLIPDCGGTWFLPRLIGPARARAATMLAEPISARQAFEWGMIWKLCEDETLMQEAHALASVIVSKPPLGLELTKRALDISSGNSLDDQLDLERDLQRQAGHEPGYMERVRAFLSK